jgi:Ca2+-binding RTX toxin-like protein
MAVINGTPANDTLRGTQADDQIFGFGGDDFLSDPGGENGLYGGIGNDLLTGGADSDYLHGDAGNDTIDGGGSDDEVSYDTSPGTVTVALSTGIALDGFGGTDSIANVERIRGSGYGDRLTGDGGDNHFRPLGGNDTVLGGSGIDWVRYDVDAQYGGTWGVRVDLAAGTGRDGFGNTDTLVSIERATGTMMMGDELFGSSADNLLEGLGGYDLLYGGAGNDVLDGGEGSDIVTYRRDGAQGAAAGVTVDLAAGTATDEFGDTDTLISIESAIGTDADDSLRGDAAANLLRGEGGRDALFGEGGDDTLAGGPGDDYLDGGDGNDVIQTQDVVGGFGDHVRPGLGADTIIGSLELFKRGEGFDLAYDDLSGIGGVRIVVDAQGSGRVTSGIPGAVQDTFFHANYFVGSQDADSMVGNDQPADSFRYEGFQGGAGNDTIDGGISGLDVLDYRAEAGGHANPRGVTVNLATGVATDTYGFTDTVLNIEGVEGTAFADSMTAEASVRFIQFRGLDGADTLTGAAGTRTLADYSQDAGNGGPGGITADLVAGLIRDGFGWFDTVARITDVRGTARADRIVGDAGDNVFDGLAGNDTLIGGPGDDVLRDGEGNDSVVGGAGDDRFEVGPGRDTFDGGAGNDTFVLSLTDAAPGAYTLETDLVAGTSGVVGALEDRDVLIGFENVEMSGAVDAIFIGTGGANRLSSGSGNDRLVGAGGNDSLSGGDGADTLNGGDGDDVISGGATAADLRDVIYGGAGNDSIEAGHGNDLVFGGDGNDSIEGGFGADEITGQGGDDLLAGSAFADLIFGGDGSDFINGGFGSDRVNGGAGADRFYHLGIAGHGSDWIQDFSSAEGDRLVHGGAGFRSQFQVNLAATPNAGADGVQEAFVIYRPTGQILWALVDGGGQEAINLQIGGQVFDLLA